VAAAIYAASVSALFGTSALDHRVTWTTPARRRMPRLDHAMIFLRIAGTYPPVGLLVLEGTLATVVLAVGWGGALAGIVLELAWTTAPRWLGGTVYLALAGGGGGHAAAVRPPRDDRRAAACRRRAHLLGRGRRLCLRRPDPVPVVFGCHEVFHLLVIAGVAAHFLAISLSALPTG
jgi:hemolysin III